MAYKLWQCVLKKPYYEDLVTLNLSTLIFQSTYKKQLNIAYNKYI